MTCDIKASVIDIKLEEIWTNAVQSKVPLITVGDLAIVLEDGSDVEVPPAWRICIVTVWIPPVVCGIGICSTTKVVRLCLGIIEWSMKM